MNRTDLQKLSNIRIREAKTLYKTSEYSGAYYLAVYAIECALKACFAKNVKRYDFPDRNGVQKIFTHKLADLLKLANLNADLAEESRYSTKSRNEAQEMIEAIAGRDGVLLWIKRRG